MLKAPNAMAGSANEVRAALLTTLSPDKATRLPAEQYLTRCEQQPGFTVMLLEMVAQIVQKGAGATPEDSSCVQVAGVYFKNTVKRCWDPEDKENSICDADKAAIKQRMVTYMCNVPPAVQRQLSEALAIISKSDFPAKWTELLPELVSKFSLQDFAVTNGVLATTNSVMKRFRWQVKSDELFTELKYCLEQLQDPLTKLFIATATQVQQLSANPAASGNPGAYRQLMPMMDALRTMSRIFYSLNWQDLPEYFEDHIKEWMDVFLQFMSFKNATLSDPDEEDEPGPIEKLQTAIVQNVNLYAEKYEEEFGDYLPGFTTAIWALLTTVGGQTKYETLASCGIKFLASVVSKNHYATLFSSGDSLTQIVEQIVVPNLLLRESDEDLFEDNPTEWIQKDLEGNDSDTRRRCAVDLVRGMGKTFEVQTTQICGGRIMAMLQDYSTDPANKWRSKDAALQLLVAVSVKTQSAAQGVSETNAAIDIMELVNNHVLPELAVPSALSNGQLDDLPILRADCIKFIATFRNQIPVASVRQLLPLVVAHLRSASRVVQSYAAFCVERLLMVKDRPAGAAPGSRLTGTPRFGRAELQPHLQLVFENLFVILTKTDESFENPHVMKAIMRCLHVAQEDVVPLTEMLLGSFNQALERVCKNPRDPHFNHYLFESVAVLVGNACKTNPSFTTNFETLLFPPFQQVLAQDVAEFSPYVFQILAQLLEYRPDGLSDPYRSLFQPLLSPSLWERKGNCPALVRLLKAYMKQGAREIIPQHLQGLLGIFQKLLALKSTEAEAFALLDSIVTKTPPEHLQSFIPTILQLLMMRLQTNMTQRFCRLLVKLLCILSLKHGAAAVVATLEGIQAGMTSMLINQIWVKTVEATPMNGASASDRIEAKVCLLGMGKLLAEADGVKGDEATWTALLSSLVSVLDAGQTLAASGEGDDNDVGAERLAFDGDAYSELKFAAAATPEDPLPEVANAAASAVQLLGQLCQGAPGVYSTRMAKLPPEKAECLAKICQAHGVQIV